MRRQLLVGALALALGLAASASHAAGYPERPVRIVVPTTQGGGADYIARSIAAELSERWGQSVFVENRPGANGVIGVEAVARAAPDGYTLLMTFTDHFVNPSLHASLPFDMIRDFAPVTFIGSLPFVLATHPAVPAKSVQELIAVARSKPGYLNFGSAGTGGSLHLAGELFKMMADVDMTHVPYKGTSAAMPDLISGQLHLIFTSAISAKPHADAGRLRLLAVTSPKRAEDLPDLPTVAESGVPNFDVGIWYGMLAPAKTPQDVLAKLNSEIGSIVRADKFRAAMAKQGVTVAPGTPAQFAQFYTAEIEKWAKVVKEGNIRLAN